MIIEMNRDQKTNSCSVKDTGKNIKTQAVEWRKIFVHIATIIWFWNIQRTLKIVRKQATLFKNEPKILTGIFQRQTDIW